MSHYWQPEEDPETERARLRDWHSILSPFPREAIEYACDHYLRNVTGKRPTPAEIRNRAEAWTKKNSGGTSTGDRSTLSHDELELLQSKILPTARRWLSNPELAEHGRKTLAYWGEPVPEPVREEPIDYAKIGDLAGEYGYTPNLSQALKRFPRATSRTQAVELNEKPADALPREAYMTPDEIRAEDEMKERGMV